MNSFLTVKINNKKVYFIFLSLVYVFSICLLPLVFNSSRSEVNNILYSFLSCFSLFFVFCSSRVFRVDYGSVFYFFIIAFSVFIFGRYLYTFITFVFQYKSNITPADLYSLSWMAQFYPNIEGEYTVFLVTNFFIVFFSMCYLFFYKSNINVVSADSYDYNLVLTARFFLYFSAPIYMYFIVNNIILTYAQGYLALYSNQMTGEQSSSILKLIFYTSISMLIVLEKNYKKYILILIVFSIVSSLAGSRGGFVTSALAVIYILHRKSDFKLNFTKTVIALLCVFTVMVIILLVSSRGGDLTREEFDVFYFLYNQGTTLGVVSYSILSDLKYEWFTLAQSFVPGFFRVYKLLVPDVQSYMGSITTFISYSANPKMFYNGNGLGTSIVSEFYIISFGNLFVFSFFSAFLGFVFYKVESLSYKNIKWFVFIIAVFPVMLFSPRSGINVLFLSSLYIYILILIFRSLSFSFLRKNKG